MPKHYLKFTFVLLIALILGGCSAGFKPTKPATINKQTDKLKRIMIVAHPDDESIFGGLHLLKHKYFIVVVTNGNNPIRKAEFQHMLKVTRNDGVILSYPDKTNGKRDNWKTSYSNIYQTLESYLTKVHYDKIVTHNKTGEYGHIHHKMVHRLVTDICEHHQLTHNLYYFGKYYRPNQISKAKHRMSNANYEAKYQMIENVYPSQKTVVKHLMHILPYEHFEKYRAKTK